MQKLVRIVQRVNCGIVFLVLTFLLLAWSYREVITGRNIIFPSNFLAQFYSPWAAGTFPGWEQGIPHKPIGTDQLRFFYPGRTFTNRAFAQRQLPLWNPYIFSGNPHAADVQSAVWYPFTIIYAFLPQLTAWQIIVVLEPILALVFTYLYVRRITGDATASWVSGIAFGLSSFMTVWSNENMSVGHAALWLPFILWSLESALREKNARYLAFAATGIAMSFLAGFFQITVYGIAFTSVYGFLRYRAEGRTIGTSIGAVVFMVCVGAGIAAIALIPSFEAYLQSPRGSTNVSYLFDTYLLPLTHLVLFFSPDVFGSPGAYNFFGRGFYHETAVSIGLVPTVFALYAMVNLRKDRLVRFFTGGAILSFLLTMGNPITRAFFRIPIPLISTFLPSRILVLTAFSLSVLAGVGFYHWHRDKRAFPWYLIAVPAAALSAVVALAVGLWLMPHAGIVKWIMEYATGASAAKEGVPMIMVRNALVTLAALGAFFVLTRNAVPHRVRSIAVLMLVLAMQFYGFHKYRVIGDRQFFYPQHPILQERTGNPLSRFIAFGYPIVPNIPMEYGLYSPEGLDPMFSKRYGELAYAAMHGGKLSRSIPRIEVRLSELSGQESITQNKERLRLLSLLGVSHIVYHRPPEDKDALPPERVFPTDQFELIDSFDGWFVARNRGAFPRAMVVHAYEVVSQDDALIRRLFSDAVDLTNTVILEKSPAGMRMPQGGIPATSSADILSYTSNRVEIRTQSTADGFLLLTDTFYPGWKAEVDGIPSEIYRADYAFRAVAVPKGNHRVVFVYAPFSFTLGVSVSVLSLLGLLLWYVRKRAT